MPFEETFTVFKTARPCPWCDRAIALLDYLQAPYTQQIMEAEMRDMIRDISGMNTVPIIQYGTDFIGGYTDLELLIKSKGLFPDDWN